LTQVNEHHKNNVEQSRVIWLYTSK